MSWIYDFGFLSNIEGRRSHNSFNEIRRGPRAQDRSTTTITETESLLPLQYPSAADTERVETYKCSLEISCGEAKAYYDVQLLPGIRTLTIYATNQQDLTERNIRAMVHAVSRLLWSSREDPDFAVSDADLPAYRRSNIEGALNNLRRTNRSNFIWSFKA